ELNAHHLQALQHPSPKMKPLPQYPGSERDWTTDSLPENTYTSTLFDAIKSVQVPLLEKFELIDLYPEKRTATFRFYYRDLTKTVSYEEVEAAHAHLLKEVLAKTKPSL